MPEPSPPIRDTRAVLHPGVMQRHVHFERFGAPELFADIVDWCWSVEWDMPAGQRHAQDTLSLPAVNISVGPTPPPGANPPPGPYPLSPRVVGVATRRSTRVLSGTGWNVAAKASIGGFGALYPGRVAHLCDREVPMGEVLAVDDKGLARRMAAADGGAARADLLLEVLERVLAQADPQRVRTAREVAALARAAAERPELGRVSALASAAGMSVRTIQRLFLEYAGVSPTWMLRRLRLIEAADRVARGDAVHWAEIAAQLGYSDQAHLSRDFTAAIGSTPSEYAAAQRDAAP